MSASSELLRAPLFHTPRNPFREANALEHFADGGLLIADGRIAAAGDYAALRRAHPEARERDLRGGYLLPGFIDTHLHYPQMRVLGRMGAPLLEWLERHTLPEEARFADEQYAREGAGDFLRALAAHGTTTALVFGSHFARATEIFFEASERSGLRIASGLTVSDRRLRTELHQSPETAYRENKELIRRFHGRALLRYAVTPRFALSTSEAMLEMCGSLLAEAPNLLVQTHLNESPREIEEVARLFPWASDYLAVYERFGLVSPRAVLAHSVHSSASEIERLAARGAAVAHCPSSNAALGSGILSLRAHVEAGVRCALGTDVGAGAGFSLMREALEAYLMQRVKTDGYPLMPEHLLYLATRAGAEALGWEAETGDFQPGKSADFVYLRPLPESPLAAVRAEDPRDVLAALFTLSSPECVRETRVRGSLVFQRQP